MAIYLPSHGQDMLGPAKEAGMNSLSDPLQWILTHYDTSVGQPTKIYIHQLCMDTECHLENLSRAMIDWGGWQERQGHPLMIIFNGGDLFTI